MKSDIEQLSDDLRRLHASIDGYLSGFEMDCGDEVIEKSFVASMLRSLLDDIARIRKTSTWSEKSPPLLDPTKILQDFRYFAYGEYGETVSDFMIKDFIQQYNYTTKQNVKKI